jgi:hypothetical protein
MDSSIYFVSDVFSAHSELKQSLNVKPFENISDYSTIFLFRLKKFMFRTLFLVEWTNVGDGFICLPMLTTILLLFRYFTTEFLTIFQTQAL